MELICNKDYLLLPASFHAKKKQLHFYLDGVLVYDLDVGLDFDQPDYLFPVDMRRFAEKTLQVVSVPEMKLSLTQINEPHFDYSGKYRPIAHYSTTRGWMNDPNGLVHHNGKYLMYYQHNPSDTIWGNMHWGSAVSTDLVHWTETGDKLFPEETGTMFSGSAIIDRKNASGLQQGDQPPILFFYTAAGGTSKTSKYAPFTQCLAVSYDGGKTLEKYAHNPLIEQKCAGNRDPKVIYYAPDDSYIMAMYLDDHVFLLLKSQDLLHWEELQRIVMPDDTECPDFYPLQVNGSPEEKWVLTAAADRYFIGRFDGSRFTPESDQQRLNYGKHSYAAQSWSDMPDGRRVRTAFADIVIPGMPFGSCMNIPQEMSLKTVCGKLQLCAWPVKEIENLYAVTQRFASISLTKDNAFTCRVPGKACDVTITVRTKETFTLELYGLSIEYDAKAQLLKCDGKEAPVAAENELITLRILFDVSYTEIYAAQGSVYMGMPGILDTMLDRLTVTSENAALEELTVSTLSPFHE